MSQLRKKDEAAVYRLAALQMRNELAAGTGILFKVAGYGICFAACDRRKEEESEAETNHPT